MPDDDTTPITGPPMPRHAGGAGAVRMAWLATAGAAWLAGVALQLQQRALDTPTVYATLAGAGLLSAAVCAATGAWRWRMAARLLAVAAAAALFGYGSTGWRAAQRLAESLPVALEGVDLVLVGVVDDMPQRTGTGLRWRFAVEQARTTTGAMAEVPRYVGLSWYRARDDDVAASQDPALAAVRAGERWELTVRLRQPHGLFNPYGFDFELWLFEQDLRATGYVRHAETAHRLATLQARPVARWRQALRDAIQARIVDPRVAGIVAALAIGDQAAIVRADWDVFRATGVAHLMSISGLHVTMLAWLTAVAVAALWRRWPRAMLLWPAPLAGPWIGLVLAAAYAVLAGWGVPAQRTVWMLAVVTGLRSLGRHWPWPPVLGLAAVVVSAFDPWALLQAGFWLSFVAVGLLMASAPTQREHDGGGAAPASGSAWHRRLLVLARGGLRTQAIATLGLAPLTLVLFKQVSLVGFAANLVAIPLVTLAITPLALLGALLPPLWSVAAALVEHLGLLLERLAGAPWAVWFVPAASPWAQAGGLLAGALAIMPLPWKLRLLALPLALPLLAPPRDAPPDGRFELIAADVGQGNAVLVRTRRHLLVYDAGPAYAPGSDAGQRVLLPLLRALGEPRVDRLVLSHRDTDHVGGAQALLSALPVLQLSSSLGLEHPLIAPLAPGVASRCLAGQAWEWDGVRFEFLHPWPSHYEAGLRPNAMSCVLRVTDRHGVGALLAGDLEAAQERELVAAHGEALRADVLLAPHHGSRTSSSPAWIDAVQARSVLVQAGYRNRFGHPAADVVQRYASSGVQVLRSDECGAWRWHSGQVAGRCERDHSRRYWHHRMRPVPDPDPVPDEPASP